MKYEISNGSKVLATVDGVKTYSVSGLQPNTTYKFSIKADNGQPSHVAYANMAYIADENSSFTLSERSTVRFGAGNNWVYKTFDAGTYTASNDIFGRDPCTGVAKRAEVVSDFSVEQGSNSTYTGFCTDLTQGGSTNPLDYTWNPIQDGDATRDGTKETISVITRGIQFVIPTALTVGAMINLRYEEYPLGTVPIGNEPSGYFGGGNKQNLSAKVISTANGSSVVEVAGNIIEVGNKNLWITSKVVSGWLDASNGVPTPTNAPDAMIPDSFTIPSGVKSIIMTTYNPNKVSNTGSSYRVCFFNGSTFIGPQMSCFLTGDAVQTIKWDIPAEATNVRLSAVLAPNGATVHDPSIHVKYEFGDQVTPYASFVDGDTFTAQPDGTCALFSEYKALYY